MNLTNFFNEFKIFILKRNAIDMALGIILGVSFGKVVSSLVNDILTPPIGLILGDVAFPNLKIILKNAVVKNGKIVQSQISINYGHFMQTVIDFLIIAFTAFLIIKFISRVIKHNESCSLDWSEYIKK